VFGVISGKKYKRVSIVAAQCNSQIISPLIYEGTTDSSLFEYWFERLLLPELPSGYLIVLDNASFHRKKILSQIASDSGCSVLFLPPYSPDLNPIERFWAWLKQKIKSVSMANVDFDSILMDCFRVV
jgi:transposase